MRGESITRVRVRYTTYTAALDQYANTRIIQSSERHRERAPAQHRTQNHPSWATQASHASGQSRKHHMLRASEMGDVRIYTEPSSEPSAHERIGAVGALQRCRQRCEEIRIEDLVEIDGGDGVGLSVVVGGGCCGTQGNQSVHQ